MAEPFKTFLNPALVHRMGAHLARAWPAFPRSDFERAALDGLDELEMKARAMQIADALEATLPARFERAATVIERALAPPWPGDSLGGDDPCRVGLEGWALWPVGEYVARRGLDSPERALRTLHALTQRFSAEFAIRPFIVAHPALTLATLQRWTADPSAHVRRLCSEGSRPRLPWGLQLKALVVDPSPTLPILQALMDDPSEYVRRSVANHLTDIGKDHPALLAQWVRTHLPGAPPQRVKLLRHACRTRIKDGDAAILRAFGLGGRFAGDAELALGTTQLMLGESLPLQVTLRSTARRAQSLVIDYAVHHVKAAGHRTAKVFKGWTLSLAPGETRVLERRHPLRRITTRRYHAGRHALDLRINGRVVAQAEFDLHLA